MIFHYAGKYNGDENSLPKREHPENYVPFKEPQSMKQLAIVANVGAALTMILLAVPYILLGRKYILSDSTWIFGWILPLLTLFPHELLHAMCFKRDVYMYTNLSQGLLFVVGTEDMSRAKFIFMSLLPNIVFGFIPYIIFLLCPKLLIPGAFGMMCIGMGFGDYMNVFNALRQVPRRAKVYMSGIHSYWYIQR